MLFYQIKYPFKNRADFAFVSSSFLGRGWQFQQASKSLASERKFFKGREISRKKMQNSHWPECSTYLQQPQQSTTGFTMSCSPGRWWSQEDNVFQSGCRSSQSFQCNVHHQGPVPLDRSGSIRHPYQTHRDRNINTIRFSCSSYALPRLHMHYYPYLVTDSNKKEWGLPKSLTGAGVCFPSGAASPSDVLNKAFLVLPEKLFA